MAFMKGEPLVARLGVLAKYIILPGAMAAALIHSPPDYSSSKKNDDYSPEYVLTMDMVIAEDMHLKTCTLFQKTNNVIFRVPNKSFEYVFELLLNPLQLISSPNSSSHDHNAVNHYPNLFNVRLKGRLTG